MPESFGIGPSTGVFGVEKLLRLGEEDTEKTKSD